MSRKPLPYDDLVSEVRKYIADANATASMQYSDDTDQWYVGKFGYSPMLRQEETLGREEDKAKELAAKLLEIGEPASAAVAKGLRTTGRWRENLMPFAEKYRDVPIIREALELVEKRERDPLAVRACWIAHSRPARFSTSIRGHKGRSFHVALQSEELVYEVYEQGCELPSVERLATTPDDWCTFVLALERIGVRHWRRNYEYPGRRDGTNWSLYIAARDLRVASSGSNEYPERFKSFLKSMGRLVGGRPFE